MLTYEQCVATAMLNALDKWTDGAGYYYGIASDFNVAVYALRRLRVRAGLTP